MILIELALMGAMYPNKKLNLIIAVVSALALVAFFIAIRHQTAIFDRQFLKSMIPHHASALLMCNEAPIEDAEIQALCKSIVAGQQTEIDQMEAILKRLNGAQSWELGR
jgi:uncharacterized protein (DUF305 family)